MIYIYYQPINPLFMMIGAYTYFGFSFITIYIYIYSIKMPN